MQINAHTNIDTVLKELAVIQTKGQQLAPLFAELANHLYNLADETFENETSPDGSPWQPLSPQTIARKGHSRKLHASGHLRETLSFASDTRSATVGTNAVSVTGYPYPAVQQFGTTAGKVPARPFLPFSAEGDLMAEASDSILTLVHEYFEEA